MLSACVNSGATSGYYDVCGSQISYNPQDSNSIQTAAQTAANRCSTF
jgi:hypothetical protein